MYIPREVESKYIFELVLNFMPLLLYSTFVSLKEILYFRSNYIYMMAGVELWKVVIVLYFDLERPITLFTFFPILRCSICSAQVEDLESWKAQSPPQEELPH